MTTKAEDQSTMESKHDQFLKRFMEETGVSPAAAGVVWHLRQAYRLLHQDVHWATYRDFTPRDSREIDIAYRNFAAAIPPLEGYTSEKCGPECFCHIQEEANGKGVGK